MGRSSWEAHRGRVGMVGCCCCIHNSSLSWVRAFNFTKNKVSQSRANRTSECNTPVWYIKQISLASFGSASFDAQIKHRLGSFATLFNTPRRSRKMMVNHKRRGGMFIVIFLISPLYLLSSWCRTTYTYCFIQRSSTWPFRPSQCSTSIHKQSSYNASTKNTKLNHCCIGNPESSVWCEMCVLAHIARISFIQPFV